MVLHSQHRQNSDKALDYAVDEPENARPGVGPRKHSRITIDEHMTEDADTLSDEARDRKRKQSAIDVEKVITQLSKLRVIADASARPVSSNARC